MKKFTSPVSIGLKQGSQGAGVEELQEFLRRFGYLAMPADKTSFSAIRAVAPAAEVTPQEFDQATKEAVVAYQKFHGLPVTGELDDATATQMGQPRCGFPDVPDSNALAEFVAQGNKWDKTDLTYGFDNFTPDLTPDQVRTALAAALGLWSAVTPLTFTEVASTASPDIRILFGDDDHGDSDPFDGIGNVLAHAYYPPPNGGAIAGDAHFDEAETWSVGLPVSAIDLMTVAAHEFGHSLGLAHSTVAGSLMFPSYSGAHRFLHADDVAGIQSIYGALSLK